jgi:hypothetical protein
MTAFLGFPIKKYAFELNAAATFRWELEGRRASWNGRALDLALASLPLA